jgi:hypothetical protein
MTKNNRDPIKSIGKSIGKQFRNVDVVKKRVGLLPDVDRTRGSMGYYKPHIINFNVDQKERKVFLTLNFFPLFRQYIQGAHGHWTRSLINIWNPHFKRLTTPGHLLLAFVATQGSIFDGNGVNLPDPVFRDPITLAIDNDWTVVHNSTTNLGRPFVAGFAMAWRLVRSNERTHEPVTVEGGIDSVGAGERLTASVWLWEIEDGGPPKDVTASKVDNVVGHQPFDIGTYHDGAVVGGFVTSLFNRSISPVATYPGEMQMVPYGTAYASYRQDLAQKAIDGAVSYGAFGNEWHGYAVAGDWWEELWDTSQNITHVTMLTLKPWVFYNPWNPSGVLTLYDGQNTQFDFGYSSQWQGLGLDLQGVHTVSGMRFTFGVDGPTGQNDSGWNEIIAWYDDPNEGQNINSADMRNNPLPYHGWFAGGTNELFPPWMYIGQTASGILRAELFNDIEPGGWSIAGASMVVPGLKLRLPTIPFPNIPGQYMAADNSHFVHTTIVENVKITASGEGANMPAELYASGVRVFIDATDISQYVFGKPSGVVDINNWRWDDIDISQWVRSPGQHKLVITTDEGEADVDTRFEVY